MGSTILPTPATPTGTTSRHQESEPTPTMATQAIQPTALIEPVVAATPSSTHNTSGTQPSTASSRKTRGGSTIRSAARKSGQSLDQIYPDLFKPTNRATFKDLLSETENIRVFYPWVAANPPSATEMTMMKNKVDYRIRQVLFVFCSTKPLGRIVVDACPDISNTSSTFSNLYGYAQRMSANFKHRLLYQQMYGLARTWLDDFGYQDFSGADLEHTKRWIYSRVDATLFKVVFKQWAPILDWENTFGKRYKKPFYYLKIMFATMMKEVAFVVISEEIMNQGRQWRPTIMTGWKRDDTQRRICDKVFDSLAAFENFEDIELNHFTWLPAGSSLQEPNEDLVIAHSELLNQHIISNSPPPGSESDEPSSARDSPRRKTTQRPPRHHIQRPASTDTTDSFGMPYAMSAPKTKDTAKPQPTSHGHPQTDDGPRNIGTRGKQIIVSDHEQDDDDDCMLVDDDEDIFRDSQQHAKLTDKRASTSPGYDEDDQPLLRAASIKYSPHIVAAVDDQRARRGSAGPSVRGIQAARTPLVAPSFSDAPTGLLGASRGIHSGVIHVIQPITRSFMGGSAAYQDAETPVPLPHIPSFSQPTGSIPPSFQGITRTPSKRMSPPPPSRSGWGTGLVRLSHSRILVPAIPTSGTGSVHGRSPVQRPTQQSTAFSATVNVATIESIPTAKTSPTGSTAGGSTSTAQATSVTRTSSRNRRISQRALEADGNTQTVRTNTRGVTARRSSTPASRGKGAGSGRSGKHMSQSVEQQQRTRLGRGARVDDGS
ncbi:hypothetical protein N657DRAFT_651105 [Parathielavia appendiculata]|uniref:Uncharacterized protein n=1 Tax=Parathielavia appendiculata TaxID=2587402 RepID=A0AAN6TQR7_9PEZI|nr:hypothetical protein N657DRAFT_651105 [Parathielavia appendiculata]